MNLTCDLFFLQLQGAYLSLPRARRCTVAIHAHEFHFENYGGVLWNRCPALLAIGQVGRYCHPPAVAGFHVKQRCCHSPHKRPHTEVHRRHRVSVEHFVETCRHPGMVSNKPCRMSGCRNKQCAVGYPYRISSTGTYHTCSALEDFNRNGICLRMRGTVVSRVAKLLAVVAVLLPVASI